MRLPKAAGLVVLLCAVTVSAQTVDEIIAKNIQAHGGLAKLKAIQTMRITGSFETAGIQADFTQVYKRPAKLRRDATVNGITLTQAYDGQKGWQIIPFTGNQDPEPMASEDLKRIQEEADFDGPLVDYKEKGNAVELVGKEQVSGADSYHLKVTLRSGEVRDMYLDAKTFLVIKTLGPTTVQGMAVEMESTFSDYKEVQGAIFPFSIEQHAVDGQVPSQKISFQKIETNVPVEDALFKMPSAAPPPAPAAEHPKAPDAGTKPPSN